MSKRKRDDSEPLTETNPPVPALQNDPEDFLVHVLNVSAFVTSKSGPNESQLESLGRLLGALEEERILTGCPVSEKDVSLLLLPWAIRNVLSGTSVSRWAWHSLFVSLHAIVNSDDSYTIGSLSSQVLTQSTLFKLCPKIALFVVSNSENDSVGKSYAAKAYVIITEKLFNPTMDVACKSLLLVILDEETQPDPNNDIVLTATLQLIHRLMMVGKGNPKTAFQLLSSAPILIALSKVHSYFQARENDEAAMSRRPFELTKEIFSFGFFHPTHLQGLYSLFHKMKTAPFSKSSVATIQKEKINGSFRCYQEELLATVENTLSLANPQNDADGETSNDGIAVMHAMPILFQVFLEQKWEERGEFSKKKSQTVDPVNMHFQMFATWMVRLQQTVETGDNSLRSAALQSMLEMLNELLVQNAYSASLDDSGGYFFDFLAGIYNQIISASIETWDEHSRECTIPILNVLLRLNHRLVHEQLGKLITYTLEIGVYGHENHAIGILVEVFTTYEKLRQQSYFIGEILNALRSLQEAGKSAESDFFLDLLMREEIRLAASQALSSCPIALVKEIFDLFEEWFTLTVSERNVTQTGDIGLCVAVGLVEMLSQSAIVDKSTASNIAEMGEHFMEKVVSNLTAFMAVSQGPLKQLLVDLTSSMCAWMIDLHIRCTFWLGRHIHLAIPALLSELLSTFRCLRSDSSSCFTGTFNGVLLLACNRLTQIDTEIHDAERKAIEAQDERRDTDAMLLEGKELASSIFYMSSVADCAETRRNRHPWFITAKHCFQWLKFAEDDHISEFLNWVCRNSLIPILDNAQDPAVAMRAGVDLLCDSRFTEHYLIYRRLFPEALNAAFDLIKSEVYIKGNENNVEFSALFSVLNHPMESDDDSIAQSFQHLQEKEGKLSIEKLDDRLVRSFERAVYLLREVAAPSFKSRDITYDKRESLQLLCKLDFAFRALGPFIATSLSRWKDTKCVLRKIISQLMEPILSESLQKTPKMHKQSLQFIQRMFDSFAMIDQEGLNEDAPTGFEHIVSCIVKALLDSRLVSGLIVSIRMITSQATERKKEHALIAFTRFILEGVRKFMDSGGLSSLDITQLLTTLWGISQLCRDASLSWNNSSGQLVRIEGMLLATDLLKLDFNDTQYSQLFDAITLDKSTAIHDDTVTEESAKKPMTYRRD